MGLLHGLLPGLDSNGNGANDNDNSQSSQQGGADGGTQSNSNNSSSNDNGDPSNSSNSQNANNNGNNSGGNSNGNGNGNENSSNNVGDGINENSSSGQTKSTKSTTTNPATHTNTSQPAVSAKDSISASVGTPNRDAGTSSTSSAVQSISQTQEVLTQSPLASSIAISSGVMTFSGSTSTSMSNLVTAQPSSAGLAQDNSDATNNAASVLTPGNKLFPLVIVAIVVGGIFFLISATVILMKLSGWNRKRRARKLTPSFASVRPTNTMFEPKFETITTNMSPTQNPYNTLSDHSDSTYDIERQEPEMGVASTRLQATGQDVPRIAVNGGTGDYDRDAQAYDGAFFPASVSSYNLSNPFDTEEYQTVPPKSNPQHSTTQRSTQSNRSGASGLSSGSRDGSPVPSFNTGRMLDGQTPYQARLSQTAAPRDLVSGSRGPPSQSSMGRNRSGSRGAGILGSNPPSAGEWMTNTSIGGSGGRSMGRVDIIYGSDLSSASSGSRGRGGKLGKQPTWQSDRV